MSDEIAVGRYRIRCDRAYDRDTHLWVLDRGSGRVRVGFDPLGAETSGDVVAISLEPVGTRVERGGSFGTMEAAKFVGSLRAPCSGVVAARNEDLMERPGAVMDDPYGSWLVELEPEDPAELEALIRDRGELEEWFRAEVRRFDEEGMTAE